jgi:RNA polymerase sigma-70 factor (ECF subfamily)
VQDVLLALHAKRQTWQPDSPVLPWLYAIARYKTVDAFRRRGTAVHLPIEDFIDILESTATDTLAARDSARLIDRLDSRSAQIVRAISLDGEDSAAVGDRLGMSEGAVRVDLHRAIKRMGQFIGGKSE